MRRALTRWWPVAAALGVCALAWWALGLDLRASLLPHARAVEWINGFAMEYVPELGYREAGGLFVITRGCLGDRLFAALLLIWSIHIGFRASDVCAAFRALALAVPGAAALAFAFTVVRIELSIPLCGRADYQTLHNLLSLVVYFFACLALNMLLLIAPGRTKQ